MANVKISQLPSTNTPQGAGLIPIVQDGTTYSTTASDLVALAGGGVTEFNTRTGNVTLLSADVTGALGFTPADAADVVPNTRELTINGVTQDLSANRTFTIASGAPTYPFTGASINAGEAVVINSNGTVSSAVSGDPLATANATRKGVIDYSVFAGSPSSPGMRTRVSPHDPSLTVRTFYDGSNQTLYMTATQNNDTETNFPLSGVLTIGGSILSCDFQFDPFNPDLILVMYNQSGNMYLQYISINHTYNNTAAPRLILQGPSFAIPASNWSYYGFQFSVKYPNTIVAQYSDNNAGQLPYVVSLLITPMGTTSFSVSSGTAYSLSANGYFGTPSNIQVLNRLEGTDTFIASFFPYDSDPAVNAYVNQVALFKIDPTYNDYNTPPALVLGTPYTMVDYTNPSYQYSTRVAAFFLSSTKIAYSFKEGMAQTYLTVIGDVSGLTVNSIGSPVEFSNGSVDSLEYVSTSVYPMPINGQQYIVYVGIPQTGGNSYNIICGIGKITGTTILFSSTNVLAYNGAGVDMTTIGYFTGVGMVVFTPSSVLNGVVLANLLWFNSNSSGYGYFKTSTINYINKVFTNQTLLGIAQNTVTMPATVNVLPFGNVDDNQSGLVAGTSYYLQDNGVVTTNVTPTLLGTALSASSIKTANYPTI
jgi:hypothetical protein